MKREVGVGILVLGALLGAAYYWHSRFDRLATHAQANVVAAADWEVLRAHPDDPRVIAAAARELRFDAPLPGPCDGVANTADRAGPVLDAHPTSDDESLAAIAQMLASCPDPRPAKWTSRSPEDLVRVWRKDLPAAAASPKDVLPAALIRLSPRVSQELIDVVVASLKPDEQTARALVTAGFPENGERLPAPTDNAIRRPVKTDTRVGLAMRNWLGALKEKGPNANEADCIFHALQLTGDVALDDAMAEAIARAIDVPRVQAICRKLVVLPRDAELLQAHGGGPAIEACAAPALQMRAPLDALNGAAVAAAAAFEDERGADAKTKRDTWENEQAEAVARLGPIAIPAAREGLKSDARSTRRVSARTYVKLDRAGYLATMTERLHAHAATGDDAKLLLELMMKTGGFEAAPALAAYYSADIDAVKRTTALLKVQKPALWVPTLFADLSVTTVSNPAVIGGYMAALEGTMGTAPLCAAMLDAAVTRAGRPDAVFWLTKALALRVLKKFGTPANAPLVEKFLTDRGTYFAIKLRNEKFTEEIVEESRRQENIADLATATLSALKNRGAKADKDKDKDKGDKADKGDIAENPEKADKGGDKGE